ncbi:amino acid adenylation domain-containing protein [Burkholderia sp. Ac-20345]|uniref:amino acid adenylation domain-containing protein n=1 Tax=Burkholderia sp. Ac-20345 TaxID=2703891 RepID=UPI00197C32B3|nr:amino acid adenylation domain-containing protein [Burkholderia sp. Ac-20345]MBN3779012.1 amino acid adenylation domain-containing protein [Burkholderia sp. Ac-20345]
MPVPNTSAEKRQRADALIAWLREYADTRINSRLIDERRCFPPHLILDFGNKGLLGMQIPEAYGGLELDNRDVVRVLEQLGAIDLTLASLVLDSLLGAHTILRYATPEMRDEILPQLATGRLLSAVAVTESAAGSNPRAITMTAVPDGQGGWLLRGVKRWVGYGAWAGVINVYAQLLDEEGRRQGITGFMVQQGAPGLRLGEEAETLGMRGYVKNTLHFDDVPVSRRQMLGEPGAGMEAAQDTMMYVRIHMGAVCLGGIKRCLQLMHRFAARRTVATGLLLENPTSLQRLGELTAAATATEALIRQVAECADTPSHVPDEVSMVCKTHGSEFLWWAADMLVQCLGARGYEEASIAARTLRDARPFRIFEGPTEALVMHLGSSAVHGGEALYRYLEERAGTTATAQDLREAAGRIEARCLADAERFGDHSSRMYRAYALAGEVAAEAILLAGLQHDLKRTPTPARQRALSWARRRFEEARARALGASTAEVALETAAGITQLVQSYAGSIGDVEQSLPGDDVSLDPLLRRTMQPAPATTGNDGAILAQLSDQERHQLLVEWNQTASAYPETECVHHLFERQAEQTPNAVAASWDGQEISYAGLNARANQLAHYLRAQGVGPDMIVGICIERSIDMLIGMLGILKAGGAYLPLDPSYPEERLAYVIADSGISLLLTQQPLLAALPPHCAEVVCIDRQWDAIADMDDTNLRTGVTPEHLAYVIYTSGSTGKAKGVLIEHRAVVNLTTHARSAYDLRAGDRVLQFASLSFDAAAEEIYPCLASGATLVLRTDDMISTTSAFFEACERLSLTVLDLPTAYWHQLALDLEGASVPVSLRLVIIGGERALGERVRLWREHCGASVRLVNTYGPTETTVIATSCDLGAEAADMDEPPIGRPIANFQVYVLDAVMQPVRRGDTGELYIGGAGLARGYLNRKELTKERFVTAPFCAVTGARLYKTGDIVRYLPDGNLKYVGRVDDQVKIRGFRIEPGEIEAALADLAAVRQAIVLAREPEPGVRHLVAYVVPATDDIDDAELVRQVRKHLQGRLPHYMLPAAVMPLGALPVLPNGKIDRAALPAPATFTGARTLDESYVAPRTPAEAILAEKWGALFGVEVGVHDNFFELGGHSLLAMQFIARIQDAFPIPLTWQALFAQPTVAKLAHYIASMQAVAESSGTSSASAGDLEEVTL